MAKTLAQKVVGVLVAQKPARSNAGEACSRWNAGAGGCRMPLCTRRWRTEARGSSSAAASGGSMPFSSWSPWSPQRRTIPASVDAWTDARRRTHISEVIALGQCGQVQLIYSCSRLGNTISENHVADNAPCQSIVLPVRVSAISYRCVPSVRYSIRISSRSHVRFARSGLHRGQNSRAARGESASHDIGESCYRPIETEFAGWSLLAYIPTAQCSCTDGASAVPTW